MQGQQPKQVYTIIEREDGPNLWLKIGIAWVNRDGSINVKLDALPVNGMLHIRDKKEESTENRSK